jgi:hypothetical protein
MLRDKNVLVMFKVEHSGQCRLCGVNTEERARVGEIRHRKKLDEGASSWPSKENYFAFVLNEMRTPWGMMSRGEM